MNIIAVVRIGSAETIAGVGLGTVTVNMLCLSLMIGANGAQETLASQAFGMGDLKLCGQYLNRGRAIITLIFLPSAVILTFGAEPLLLYIGQDPLTAQEAAYFIRVMLLNQYIIGHCDLLKRFLNCVNLSYIPMIATIVTTFIHIIWLLIFVGYLKWDIFGVALSSTITNGLQLAYVWIYASRREDIKEAIFMPDMDAFNGWKMYLKLALPATLMLCGEWWYFELLTLTSGYLGVKE